MDDLKKIVQSLLSSASEEEWYEFKENWYDAVGIGEYISSLSNAAAMCGEMSDSNLPKLRLRGNV